MPVISKPVTPAPSLLYNGINIPPSSLSKTYLYYGQLGQHLIVKMLIAVLKIVQAAQPPLPLPPLPPLPPISLGVKEIPKARGSKVKVKVLNKIYTREIPKIYLEIR